MLGFCGKREGHFRIFVLVLLADGRWHLSSSSTTPPKKGFHIYPIIYMALGQEMGGL